MDRILTIDGKEVGFRATASTPMRYRHRFGRDIFDDLQKIRKDFLKNEGFSLGSLEAFECLAYTMAKQYDPDIPDTPEDWLDQFEYFGMVEVYPELFALWAENEQMTSTAKKK